jgi:hypothetical protein
MILRGLAELLEEMERDLKRINWEDVAILCITAALVGLGVIGIVVGWW